MSVVFNRISNPEELDSLDLRVEALKATAEGETVEAYDIGKVGAAEGREGVVFGEMLFYPMRRMALIDWPGREWTFADGSSPEEAFKASMVAY